jgi:acetylornithine/N-succinyldiaminopimelate aminotransferase
MPSGEIEMTVQTTFDIEDAMMAPFFEKQKISIEKGKGVFVWDEQGNRYIDFTSGWGVTCIGHAHPAITAALVEQGGKIIQNPNSGLTYSPARARLLSLMRQILPEALTRVFFANSGAEANDAALKLARKVTGRTDIVSTHQSFHGRTISTASATGQAKHREKFNPLMPNYRFVTFNDIEDLKNVMDDSVAAVLLEPIQGEGGVRLPSPGYLKEVERICRQNESLLIIDEVQTGFCRTGPMFAILAEGVCPDFITMAKGIAGGFPFGAFAMSQRVVDHLEKGDHGGTYCGNPLGCAVASAVIGHLIENRMSDHVEDMERLAMTRLKALKKKYPDLVSDVRGKGLLLLIECVDEKTAGRVSDNCLTRRLFVRQTNGAGIRIFPALNIKEEELLEGLAILNDAVADCR